MEVLILPAVFFGAAVFVGGVIILAGLAKEYAATSTKHRQAAQVVASVLGMLSWSVKASVWLAATGTFLLLAYVFGGFNLGR